jgi:tRNA pseudouridine38-40 synthase
VHAINHVSDFTLEKEIKIPLKKLPGIVTSKLPSDIVCLDVEEVPLSFSARYSAKLREYLYIIDTSGAPSAFHRGRVWSIDCPIPIKKLKKTLKHVVGEHDFTSFCANLGENPNRIRKIIGIKVKKKKNRIYINIRGYAFLHKMIRLITGSAVAIALSDENHTKMKEVLSKKETTPYKPAPAGGLYLYKIAY